MDCEELVEKMAEAINASSAAALPWAKLIDEAAQYPYSETWVRFCRDAARAALAVAEPAVRADERLACLNVAHRWTRDGRSATAHGIILGIEERTGGTP